MLKAMHKAHAFRRGQVKTYVRSSKNELVCYATSCFNSTHRWHGKSAVRVVVRSPTRVWSWMTSCNAAHRKTSATY